MNFDTIKLSNKQPNRTDYFLVVLLTIFAGLGNSIFRDIRYSIIPIIISFGVFRIRRKKFNRSAEKIYTVFILFIFGYFLKYWGEFDPMFTFRIFVYITFPYLVVSVVGYNFFKIYENILYFFALISLPLFLLETVAYNFIYLLLAKLQSIMHLPQLDWEYVNVLFYTINNGSRQLRNCGFAWEPGGFSNFLILAIIINLARNRFSLKNKKLWVLLIAMITTFSTTGYLAFVPVVIWYLYNVKFKKRMILIFPLLFLAIYASTLPFMTDKIKDLSVDPEVILNRVVSASSRNDKSYTIGRFAGFLMNMEDLKEHPIIGYGGHGELTFNNRNNTSMASINGLGRWMATFGSVGFLIFLLSYIKSLRNLSLLYGFNKPLILLATILALGFGFGLIHSGLFFAFMLSYLFLPYKNKVICNGK